MKSLYEEKSYHLLFPSYFRICRGRIEAYFWPYRHVIAFSDIKEARILNKIPWYIGWGLRINPFNRTLYFAVLEKGGPVCQTFRTVHFDS